MLSTIILPRLLLRLMPLLWLITLSSCLNNPTPRQSCEQGYHLCPPEGASFSEVPEIGPGLAKLYLSLVETVNPQPAPAHRFGRSQSVAGVSDLDPAKLLCFTNGKEDDALAASCSDKGYGCLDLVGGTSLDTMYHTGKAIKDCDENCQCAQPLPRRSTNARLCQSEGVPVHKVRETETETASTLYCADTTECMFLLNYDVPLCWDQFTTNYYLPDGSYGSIISGNYTTSNGDQANLITGIYRLANGQTGNIYQGDILDEPNTSSMPIPTPWTSSGAGSAIPASELGSRASSNSSGIPLLPTFTTTAGTSTNGSVDAPNTASALSTLNPVTNVTAVSGGTAPMTPGGAPATSATASAPHITPPVTDGVTMYASNGLLLLTLNFAVLTHLVMHWA